MRKAVFLLGLSVMLAGFAVAQNTQQIPQYTKDSVVSLAAQKPGPVAPYSLVTIYGKDLAWVHRYRTEDDVVGDVLPLILTGSSVIVTVNGFVTTVEMATPEQVTFLMPPHILPGPADIRLTRNGKSGPLVRLDLRAVAPAWYQISEGKVLARHGETWEWVTDELPARPGEKLMLYAGGLGVVTPAVAFRAMPRKEAPIAALDQFIITINGEPVAPELIEYVGLMPNFPGLYEIRLQLPANTPENPEIRIVIGEETSPEGIVLPVSASEPPDESPVEPEEAPAGSN